MKLPEQEILPSTSCVGVERRRYWTEKKTDKKQWLAQIWWSRKFGPTGFQLVFMGWCFEHQKTSKFCPLEAQIQALRNNDTWVRHWIGQPEMFLGYPGDWRLPSRSMAAAERRKVTMIFPEIARKGFPICLRQDSPTWFGEEISLFWRGSQLLSE